MEITRNLSGGVLDLTVTGRLDGYWAEYLDRALTEAIGEGHHRIRVDCGGLAFLSSAGIAVLMKFHRELTRIHGAFHVVNPSKAVNITLKLTRLSDVLLEPNQARTSAVPAPAVKATTVAQHVEKNGIVFDVYPLDDSARMTVRAVGTCEPLSGGSFCSDHCFSLESQTPTLAIGVGAFGDGFTDCRQRFGELLSVAGATAYQPADGTNTPDYLVTGGALSASVRVLYCLMCEGPFSHLVRFDTLEPRATIGLSRLLDDCLDLSGAPALGVVIVGEASGLVGAALRQSPTEPFNDSHFFTHPGVRTRLTFTAEPAFGGSVVLAAGVVTRGTSNADDLQLRPIGNCRGHVHAAAFRFRPLTKGPIDFAPTVAGLFEADQLQGVLHLLHDDRREDVLRESQFVRGACWISPIGVPAS